MAASLGEEFFQQPLGKKVIRVVWTCVELTKINLRGKHNWFQQHNTFWEPKIVQTAEWCKISGLYCWISVYIIQVSGYNMYQVYDHDVIRIQVNAYIIWILSISKIDIVYWQDYLYTHWYHCIHCSPQRGLVVHSRSKFSLLNLEEERNMHQIINEQI